MKLVNVSRKISKDGETSTYAWGPLLFDELTQIIKNDEILTLKKKNDTAVNFDYVIEGVIFTSIQFNNLLEAIDKIPDSVAKRNLVSLLK